ncbi:MAG TPA: Smr/MutS family protein [Candidatus Binatia bacterium]|nr:Smr/MutS family protein [Candidatus Binatia bacterium]
MNPNRPRKEEEGNDLLKENLLKDEDLLKGENPLGSDEEDEWEAATRDVRPLADRDDATAVRVSDVPEIGLADRLKVRREQAAAPGEGSPFALDRRTSERLKRGQIAIESQLDLHGLTQEEALEALDGFLWQAWEAGQRCVLVITGKGTAREGGGVLRTLIPNWLAEGSHRNRVLAVETAHQRHGGHGALYVLLRRQRDY